jgi:hypothetical protein
MLSPTDTLIRNVAYFSSIVSTPNHFSMFPVTLSNSENVLCVLSHGVYSQILIVSRGLPTANVGMSPFQYTDHEVYICIYTYNAYIYILFEVIYWGPSRMFLDY